MWGRGKRFEVGKNQKQRSSSRDIGRCARSSAGFLGGKKKERKLKRGKKEKEEENRLRLVRRLKKKPQNIISERNVPQTKWPS